MQALARVGLLAILAVTASSVLWSLSTSLKKSLSSVLSVLTISIGLNAGGNANTNSAKLNRVSLDYTNNKHNSKTKVLATLYIHGLCVAQLNHNATHQFCC
jgi:hypothetical protein